MVKGGKKCVKMEAEDDGLNTCGVGKNMAVGQGK